MADVCAMCCTGCCATACFCVCCVGVIIPVAIIELGVRFVISPVAVPCYFIRKKKYAKWLTEWRENLDDVQRELLITYLNGPATYETFSGITSKINTLNVNINDGSTTSQQLKEKYKYVPACLIKSKYWPCNMAPSKADFMIQLDFMLQKLENANGGKDVLCVSTHFLKNLIAETQKECTICMESFNNIAEQDLHILPCRHMYHMACINKWTESHDTCPICRAEING